MSTTVREQYNVLQYSMMYSPVHNGNKRVFPGSGGRGRQLKRFKPSDHMYEDVIFWTVDTSEMAPHQAPHCTPKGVLSIRFRNLDIADDFIGNLRARPCPTTTRRSLRCTRSAISKP
ncbi:hypothetical protein B0H16DRAFT_1881101 [Mycena metata]|uniref:Uncharacterized protein n=1 Tax=Mycena metata TaxID=1033252 RepID=A0AAD7JT74_9AGAR|nr:hypothetical protein B0H16DRAFT_1881101 [Mycena metata]